MYFKILQESKHYYYVRVYANFLSDFYNDHRIQKIWFRDWQKGKVNITDYDEIKQVNAREQRIIDEIQAQIKANGYVISSDVDKNIANNEEFLADNNLQRIRANKKIKEQYGVNAKGYPFVIIKE